MREGGEIDTQVYPTFPIMKERGVYENSLDIEDTLCHKEFPSHRKLTPGIYLITCGCKHKVIYGFSMESSVMLFDLRSIKLFIAHLNIVANMNK